MPPSLLLSLPDVLRARRELRALLFASASAAGQSDAPFARAVKDDYLAVLGSNLPLFHALEQITEAGSLAGLRLVPFKGGCLAVTHYGDPGARAMVDLDVLCAPSELLQAGELLRSLGFGQTPQADYRRSAGALHDLQFQRGSVHVELHHALWHEISIDRDPTGLLERAQEVPFGAVTAFAPAPADHLYVVLVHAAIHAFAGNAAWIADALLLAHGREDLWAEAEALAARTRARVALSAALDHLELVCPGRCPRAARGPARARRALVRRMAPWLQRGEVDLGRLPSRLVRPLLIDRPGDAARWAAGKVRLLAGGLAEAVRARIAKW